MPLTPGDVFAGYTIQRLLGAGGMGEVYLAEHPRLPRPYALKVLAAHAGDDADFRERFIREADLAAGLPISCSANTESCWPTSASHGGPTTSAG